MGLCLYQNILRRTVAHHFAQNIAAKRVVDAGGKLSVGKGSSPSLAELDVGAAVKCAAAPKPFYRLNALFNAVAPLQNQRTVAVLRQQQNTADALAGKQVNLLGIAQLGRVAAVGLLVGLAVCLLQQHYGLLKLGSGADYVISAYPVLVQAGDVLAVAAIVLLMGFLAAYYATRSLRTKEDALIIHNS